MSGRHFKGDGTGESNGLPQDAAGSGAAGQPFAGNRSPMGASMDTFEFTAAASARPASGGGRPLTPDQRAAQGVRRPVPPSSGGAGRRRPPQAGGASLPPLEQQQTEKAEFFDFNLPYGEGDATVTDDGLVRHRHRRGEKRRRNAGAVVGVVVAVLVVALGAGGFALFNSARSVRSQAKEAIALTSSFKDKVVAGDFASLPADAQELDRICASIRDEVSSPLWTAASFVPVLGGDISAARTMVDALAEVSSGGIVPISESLAGATPGKLFHDSAVNMSALEALVGSLSDAAPVFISANERVQGIEGTHIEKVTELVDTAQGAFAVLDGAARTSEKIAPVLPGMLGAGGATRNYLITAENNAEIRTQGGFAGSAGVLSVTDGVISLGDFEGVQHVPQPERRAQITISDEEMNLFQPYEPTMDFTSGDSYFTPDFPRGAWLAAKLWSLNHDDMPIDGVVAVDPTFLQYILQVTGGVTAIDGTEVDGTNAAQVLLSQVYWNYPADNEMQDAVFASVADAAFDKLLGGLGDVDIAKLSAAVSRGVSEGRLLMWMADEREEEAIAAAGITGALPTDPADPQTGVYVNNYSYSKLDWYLNLDAVRGSSFKNADGTVSYNMTVTMKNDMSLDDAENLPAYVQAHNGGADSPAQQMLRLYLYAPMGGFISDVSCSSGQLVEGSHNGLQVLFGDMRLMPQEEITVTYTVTVPAEGANEELEVRVTPTAEKARTGEAAEQL